MSQKHTAPSTHFKSLLFSSAVMKKWGGLLGLSVFLSAGAIAEESEDYATGFIPEKPEVYAAMPQTKRYRAHLPHTVDISANFPVPGRQGNQSSCVAWATAYAARSYLEIRKQGWEVNDPSHLFSPAFIYNQINSGRCDRGTSISEALNLLQKTGVVPLSEFPYDQKDCSKSPAPQTVALAGNFRIKDWLRVNEQKLDDIKGQIYLGNPVIFGMSVSDEFKNLKGDEIYNDLSMPNPNQGHAMVLVGYDDKRQAFKLMNSWGTRWGNNGFGWVSYPAFQTRVQNTFVMNVAGAAKPLIESKIAPTTDSRIKPLTRPELEHKLAEMIAKVDCAKLIGMVIDDATVSLSGFVGRRTEIERLVNGLQSQGIKVANAVETKPWPQCEVLLKFDEALAKPTDLKVRVAGSNKTVLKEGEQLKIEVTTPSYPSYLYVSYIQANGDAVHLVQPGAKMLKPLSPNTTLTFGDGKNGRPQFRVRKPFGDEMIIAIASSSPLFAEELPQNQIEREYLSQIEQFLLNQSIRKVLPQDISVAVATLATQAKP